MSAFSNDQIRKLTGKLDRRHVQSRKVEDRDIDYIEGWFAIAEANAIFGFGGWDREMTHFERVFERTRGDLSTCAYLARVRIRVKAGSRIILREGTGWGAASAHNIADAHERAIKSAETDATKRALATFGNRFGLGLYDKDQAGVTPRRNSFIIREPGGSVLAGNLSPEGFCSGLRQLIENPQHRDTLQAWRSANADEIARLKTAVPDLKNSKGEHFADLLGRLFRAKAMPPKPRMVTDGAARDAKPSEPNTTESNDNIVADHDVPRSEDPPASQEITLAEPSKHDHARPQLNGSDPPIAAPNSAQINGIAGSSHPQNKVETSDSGQSVVAPGSGQSRLDHAYLPLKPSRIALGARIDKAALAIAAPPRRLRDKRHLRHVGTLPCLVCKEAPSHPHHLTFAQARGLAVKVSDEFVVPLCAVHHNDLHRSGNESLWWQRLGIDPLVVARALWEAQSRAAQSEAAHT